jgi:hypothetical protein
MQNTPRARPVGRALTAVPSWMSLPGFQAGGDPPLTALLPLFDGLHDNLDAAIVGAPFGRPVVGDGAALPHARG